MSRIGMSNARLLRASFALVILSFVLLALGAGHARPLRAAAEAATLTLSKTTVPAGGEDFPLTAVGWQQTIKTGLRSPRDIERDSEGKLYVIGRRASRIIIYKPDGTPQFEFGSKGKGPTQMLYPEALSLSMTGPLLIYVADTENDRVQIYDPSGVHVGGWGSEGTGPGQFSSPMGIVLDDAGNVYVSDTFNHRIQKFDPDGNFLMQWGGEGSGEGQFNFPAGLDIGPNGDVYVADSNNNRVQVFTSEGDFVRAWGSLGNGAGQFNLPADLHVNSAGDVFVSDTYNERIQKFIGDGRYLAMWGSQGTAPGQFQRPNGLTIDDAGMVYVVDIDNQRVEIFKQATVFLDDGQQESLELPPGAYTITEPQIAGWTIDPVECDGGDPGGQADGVTVRLTEGSTVACAFTNRAETVTGDLTIEVYNDLDQDGQWSEGDTPLAGWTVLLRDASNVQVGEDATTGADGRALFAGIPAGDYSACEILPVGWFNSDPGGENGPTPGAGLEICRPVTLGASGATAQFGNFEEQPAPTYSIYLPVILR